MAGQTVMDEAMLLRGSVSIGMRLHQVLRNAIVRAELEPGAALSEAEIAGRYGVSRQPVREAFIRLAQEGLVEIRPQRGTYVKKIVAAEVFDARFVREVLEVAIAREAARCIDHEGINCLRDLLLAQRKARTNAEFLAVDEAMHQKIAQIARRESAWQVIDQIKAQMDRVRYLSYNELNPADRLIAQHEEIVEAIAAHDPEAAEAAVRGHMADLLTQVPALAERYPDLFARE
jgi:DNA-binding GntR family transcriptional regulator